MDHAIKQSIHQFHEKFFHISKCFACNTMQCSLTLVSILGATLWMVAMKFKIVMLFNFLVTFFSKCSFLMLQNFISPSIKHPINLIFSVVVCTCKIHAFNGVIPSQIIQNFWNMSPLAHGVLKFSPVVSIIEI